MSGGERQRERIFVWTVRIWKGGGMRRSPPSKTSLERGSRARGGEETFPFGEEEEDTVLVSLLTTEYELGTFRRKSVAPGNRKRRVTESSLGKKERKEGAGDSC